MIEAAGAFLLHLPPCNPGFDPIEHAAAKLNALLRKAASRTTEALRNGIKPLANLVTPKDRENVCAAAGYVPD